MVDETAQLGTQTARKASANPWPLRVHLLFYAAIVGASTAVAVVVLAHPETRTSLAVVLSSGAILATFGSALSGVGSSLERGMADRVQLDVDILFHDILEQEPWRRWPFLPRFGKQRLLGDYHRVTNLKNPEVPLDVGTHVIRVDLPTIPKDFFDLPLWRNLWTLERFFTAFQTASVRSQPEARNPDTGMTGSQEWMAYDCMRDIWRCVFTFRVARYVFLCGASLTFSSVFTVLIIALTGRFS